MKHDRCENSDVFPPGSVAIADTVAARPSGDGSGKSIVALPEPSVVTGTVPRNVSPWGTVWEARGSAAA